MATGGTCTAPAAIPLNGTTILTGTATGDTTVGTSMVGEGTCAGFDTGLGVDNIWSFTLATPLDVTITLQPSVDFDGAIRLLTTPCDLTTGIANDANPYSCADEGFEGETETLAYAALPAGTYYLVVDSYSLTASGAYTLGIRAFTTVCGDGAVTGGEQCDDANTTAGDGCDATCHTEPGYDCGTAEPSVCVLACGNGTLDSGEECDDGNNNNGDRCSATCTLESDLAEVEPNNTTAQIITPVHHQIRGSLTAGDADLFRFTLTTTATVEFETYDSMDLDSPYEGFAPNLPDVDCETISTTLTLFDSTGVVTDNTTGLYTDDFDGDFDENTFATCGYLGPADFDGDTMQGVLGPGTYTIKVEETNGVAQTRYILDMKVTP
jgi:cysteine-rich repeat protein